FIVPSELLRKFSGHVLLRERIDEQELDKELEDLGISGSIQRIANPWYYRKKGSDTWIKIGESDDRRENFPVPWDTDTLPNGEYEVLGLMHVFVKKDNVEHTIARQNIVEVVVEN
ncbi:MAG: hypothetical protein V3S51_01150, partial [Dehalococcoidia bacterium]